MLAFGPPPLQKCKPQTTSLGLVYENQNTQQWVDTAVLGGFCDIYLANLQRHLAALATPTAIPRSNIQTTLEYSRSQSLKMVKRMQKRQTKPKCGNASLSLRLRRYLLVVMFDMIRRRENGMRAIRERQLARAAIRARYGGRQLPSTVEIDSDSESDSNSEDEENLR
ncbi:hypothetical protein BJ508DRAFT_328134 [Ascobolus immersus RN42]|uniref:Uncharacterized protein n=1 Tax=Ascobolus immersus RN42 TaxID=1160509 RepID=A0A3N4I0T1_ASCIM|nr:hypothetical protein BJ508DRAFT_328134 [Ascobolus immersus RN42]